MSLKTFNTCIPIIINKLVNYFVKLTCALPITIDCNDAYYRHYLFNILTLTTVQ